MPYDPGLLRTERFHCEISYHAAFNFWNLRGVLAERWGHGPIFGARGEAPNQITLTPAPSPEDPAKDIRLQAAYGLHASGMIAEGPEWVPQVPELAVDWLRDAVEVFKPKKCTRVATQVFVLYPVEDAVQVSRRLRGHYYRNDHLETLIPPRLEQHRDSFHSAVDWIIPDGDSQHSLIAGIVGPIHHGAFFAWPDLDRDRQWYLGFNINAAEMNEADGLKDAVGVARKQIRDLLNDAQQIPDAMLREVLPR
jgi:hypothetical protein